MTSVSLADAKTRLSELIDRVQTGDTVTITRRGKDVAQLTAVERPHKRVDGAKLRALTDTMPKQTESAADFVRTMRDGDRY